MRLAKIKYYLHLKIAVYYDHREQKCSTDSKKWQKYNDKFWKHISIANNLREKYYF